jgi:hypothetical protein
MSLLTVFDWFEATPIGIFGRESSVFFPAVEVVHLLGLTLLLGSVLFVNLRLLGITLRREEIGQVFRSVRPLLWSAASVTLGSGLLLFLTEAVKCYFNVAFWYKMALLAVALVFQLTVQQRIAARPAGLVHARLTAAISLTLWFGVGIAGRAIAFV